MGLNQSKKVVFCAISHPDLLRDKYADGQGIFTEKGVCLPGQPPNRWRDDWTSISQKSPNRADHPDLH